VFFDAKEALFLATKTQDFEAISNLYTLRLLEKLGYVSHKTAFTKLLGGSMSDHIDEPMPAEGLKAIDIAYRASHL
jgi:hypothetical protein